MQDGAIAVALSVVQLFACLCGLGLCLVTPCWGCWLVAKCEARCAIARIAKCRSHGRSLCVLAIASSMPGRKSANHGALDRTTYLLIFPPSARLPRAADLGAQHRIAAAVSMAALIFFSPSDLGVSFWPI